MGLVGTSARTCSCWLSWRGDDSLTPQEPQLPPWIWIQRGKLQEWRSDFFGIRKNNRYVLLEPLKPVCVFVLILESLDLASRQKWLKNGIFCQFGWFLDWNLDSKPKCHLILFVLPPGQWLVRTFQVFSECQEWGIKYVWISKQFKTQVYGKLQKYVVQEAHSAQLTQQLENTKSVWVS